MSKVAEFCTDILDTVKDTIQDFKYGKVQQYLILCTEANYPMALEVRNSMGYSGAPTKVQVAENIVLDNTEYTLTDATMCLLEFRPKIIQSTWMQFNTAD